MELGAGREAELEPKLREAAETGEVAWRSGALNCVLLYLFQDRQAFQGA